MAAMTVSAEIDAAVAVAAAAAAAVAVWTAKMVSDCHVVVALLPI